RFGRCAIASLGGRNPVALDDPPARAAALLASHRTHYARRGSWPVVCGLLIQPRLRRPGTATRPRREAHDAPKEPTGHAPQATRLIPLPPAPRPRPPSRLRERTTPPP